MSDGTPSATLDRAALRRTRAPAAADSPAAEIQNAIMAAC
jgi:hypothetical protein